MKKNYFEPQSTVMQIQGAMSQCQSVSSNPNVINYGGEASGHLD